jgi:uncharacterized membrane protein
MQINWSLLNVVGLILDFLGASILTISLFISKEKALEIGTPKWASDDPKENLELPQVRELLAQSRRAKLGFILLTVGFLLQIVGALFT